MRNTASCPACERDTTPFRGVVPALREQLEKHPARQGQTIRHRRGNHRVCPSCGREWHGCGQLYAGPTELGTSSTG